MGKNFKTFSKLFIAVSILFLLSCSSQENVTVADFDVSRIEGDYSINMKMDYSGPRPEISVFGGSATVKMTGSDNFTLFIDFPDDFITATFNGTVKEKIISSTNSAIGGVSFEIQETTDYKGNASDLFTVKTRNGETRYVYGLFIEQPGNELELNLQLVEKNQTPTTFEFTAKK